jgi:NAD(P)-dependent dehydrogenase (short-subunit alcohol dehydrogenase family)
MWHKTMNMNLNSLFYCCREFGKVMIKNGYGRIINISSMLGSIGMDPAFGKGSAEYAATKGGVNNLTRQLAVEWARFGITVNAVAPGFILNPRSKLILGTVEEGLTKRGQDVIDHTPMGNFGTAHDMCGAIRWLIDDEAAGFVTGITVPVDGGFLTLSGV